MIIVKAPLRISFVGGGTDLPDFYKKYTGRVISSTIDKFVYLVINPSYHMDDFILKYQITEKVKHPKDFIHDRFRAAMLEHGITSGGIEVGSFADIPARTGLGSSSSFTVALIHGLHAFQGKAMAPEEAAEMAAHLEIDLLQEPIGKQDQYAAAYGGLNIFSFNSDGKVDVEPIALPAGVQADFENHLLLFYTGVDRDASSVLSDQRASIESNFETYKQMSDSVYEFRDKLLAGDFSNLAQMLHEGWQKKKSLGSGITSSLIDALYETGLGAGAWGGKILGAGGGGCLLFIAPPEKHAAILESLTGRLEQGGSGGFKHIPFSLTQLGAIISCI